MKGAKPLIPNILFDQNCQLSSHLRTMGDHDCFQMKDGYGDPVMVNEGPRYGGSDTISIILLCIRPESLEGEAYLLLRGHGLSDFIVI